MTRVFVLFFFFNALGDHKTWSAGRSNVVRIFDEETGVACYVVPESHCNGDCAYSPAISCVKVKL